MRGKEIRAALCPLDARITPAYAGKRRKIWTWSILTQDHPRLCGEKDASQRKHLSHLGSPPPMRGKVRRKNEAYIHEGITPAYAGKSNIKIHRIYGDKGSPPPMRGKALRSAVRRSAAVDHPRLCGEKADHSAACTGWTGSPPPMRGKVSFPDFPWSCDRITPAYAGKSLAGLYDTSHVGDHPRLCGEKQIKRHN